MFDKIIAFFAPHECLGCAQEDTLLCTGCITALPAARGCCYHCQRVQSSYAPCAACSKVSPLASVWATTNYEHLAKTLVWHMKFERARAATTTIASALLAPPISKQTVIVPIPTATTRMRQRGYDHAKLIARHFARLHHVAYAPVLARMGQHRQVGASGERRRQQLVTAFRVTQPLADKHVILIDDVVTSGATLEAAAATLRKAGAARVDATVFARA